jgi:hypothetical protein
MEKQLPKLDSDLLVGRGGAVLGPTQTPLRCPASISELLNTNQLTRGFRHYCWYRPHTRQMGGLSCYTMCTSPKHAAPAAQALRRGSVTSRCGAHRRQETVHRLGSNSKVPRVRKLLLPPPLRVSGGDSLLDFPRGLLCDELCFLSRTAIGPPPNVTLVDWDPILTDRPNSTSSTQRHLCNKHNRPSRGICFFQNKHP